MLSGSSQGESSVLRVRLRVVKNPLRIYALAHYKYTLAEVNMHYQKWNTHHFLLVHIHNGLMRIRNGIFMTLKSDSHY